MGEYLSVVPARLRGPDWQRDQARLRRHYEEIMKVPKERDIPPWMFANTPQGRENLDVIWSHCMRSVWRLDFHKGEGRVDPRLKRQNQEHLFLGHIPRSWAQEPWLVFFQDPDAEYLVFKPGAENLIGREKDPLGLWQYSQRVSCQATNWEKFLARHKLAAGIKTHYDGEPLGAFLYHIAWAFHNPQIPGHYHYNDFTDFLARETEARARHLTDHVLREDYGLVEQRGEFYILDRRLLPDFMTGFTGGLGFKKTRDFLRATGLASVMQSWPAARGTFQGLLAACYPSAFDPRNPEHIDLWLFRTGDRFPTIVEKKEALLHIAGELRVPLEELHYQLMPSQLEARRVSDLLQPGQTMRGLVESCLPEVVLDPTGDRIVFLDGQSRFQIRGREYSFPENLDGWLVRQGSSEHMVIFGKGEGEVSEKQGIRRIVVGHQTVVRKQTSGMLRPIYVVRFDTPEALRKYNPSEYPDIAILEEITDLLSEKLPSGFFVRDISIEHQKALIRLSNSEAGTENKKNRILWYLRDRGLT